MREDSRMYEIYDVLLESLPEDIQDHLVNDCTFAQWQDPDGSFCLGMYFPLLPDFAYIVEVPLLLNTSSSSMCGLLTASALSQSILFRENLPPNLDNLVDKHLTNVFMEVNEVYPRRSELFFVYDELADLLIDQIVGELSGYGIVNPSADFRLNIFEYQDELGIQKLYLVLEVGENDLELSPQSRPPYQSYERWTRITDEIMSCTDVFFDYRLVHVKLAKMPDSENKAVVLIFYNVDDPDQIGLAELPANIEEFSIPTVFMEFIETLFDD